MASPTQWTRVWTNSGRWWSTGKSGMLQFMGLQRIRNSWATEQQLSFGQLTSCSWPLATLPQHMAWVPQHNELIRLFSFNFLRSVFIFTMLHRLQDLSSPPQNRTHAPCVGNTESSPVDQQGSLSQGCLYCTVLSFRCPGRCLGRIVRMQQHQIICQHPNSSESGCDDTKRYWPRPRAAHNLSHLR